MPVPRPPARPSRQTDTVITGGLDNMVKVWDTRKMAVLYEMSGHTNTVTGLKLSPDGNHVLSNGMDNTVRMWDVRPYAKQRLAKTFVGAQHGFEKNLIKCRCAPVAPVTRRRRRRRVGCRAWLPRPCRRLR